MIDLGTNDPVSKFEVLVTDQFSKPLPYTKLEEEQKKLPSYLYLWARRTRESKQARHA